MFNGNHYGTQNSPHKRPRVDRMEPPNAAVIDLTEDDDVVIVGERLRSDVCYGMIKEGYVNGHHVPWPKSGTDDRNCPHWPVIPMTLERHQNQSAFIIMARDPHGQQFGCVDITHAQILAPLMDMGIIRLDARMFPRPKNERRPGSEVMTPFKFFCVVYGPEHVAESVGRFLSLKSRNLERPYNNQMDNLPYKNPHEGKLTRELSTTIVRTTEAIRDDFNKVFDTLDHAENLPEMEPDQNILTPLLRHQKQGLYFLMKKENKRTFTDDESPNTSLWKKCKNESGQTYYHHMITEGIMNTRPPDILGGILADMMGLGKTLQILSLIVSTQQAAAEFAKTNQIPNQISGTNKTSRYYSPSKTTLLISPLSTMSNWEDQIQAHIKEETLNYYLYHGNKRVTDPAILATYDIVITTYQIVASEYSKHLRDNSYVSPLQQMYFFRIVLDEAHIIREQTTLQSKAVIALLAERRWAVTGTPVQNRLDDLAALIKFLRMKPFDEKSIFNYYITNPFKHANENCVLSLRLIVDSVTLRRLKDRITLPGRKDKVVFLKFSESEQELYNATQKQSAQQIEIVTKSGRVGGKHYVHVLQMIMRLRLICAHGRELLGEDHTKELAGLTSTDAINVDELDDKPPNMPAKLAYTMFSLMKETNQDVCESCGLKAKANYKDPIMSAEDKDRGGVTVIGYLTPCPHLLCKNCLPTYQNKISLEFVSGMRAQCPVCDIYNRLYTFELTTEGVRAFENGDYGLEKKVVEYRGPSSKVRALLQDLKKNRDNSTSELPIKSVVFSCWTTHLDLIQIAFRNEGVRFVRLDGTLSRTQRNEVMKKFNEDTKIEVILISLTAGGLGLNLTVACRAYVMEPQFNPAAEAQAIDRIHRLGQTRPVECIRYFMRNSFEEKILALQKKKTDLANMTLATSKKLSKDEITKQRLEELKSLFK